MRARAPGSILIAGAGFTATASLWSIVKLLEKNDNLKYNITICEKGDSVGPGIVYSERTSDITSLLNNSADKMSVLAHDSKDFVQWACTNEAMLRAKHGDAALAHVAFSSQGNEDYYPRRVYGEYLTTRFEEAVSKLRTFGCNVDVQLQHEVMGIEDRSENADVRIKDLVTGEETTHSYRKVVVATGHWLASPSKPYEKSSKFHRFPLTRGTLADVGENDHVGILGSSLSSVDAIVALAATRGEFTRDSEGGVLRFTLHEGSSGFKATCYSHSGVFPKVRGKTGAYKNSYATRDNILALRNADGHIQLDDVIGLLITDMNAAYDGSMAVDLGRLRREKSFPEAVASLRRDLLNATTGDKRSKDGSLTWYTVLTQSFPFVNEVINSFAAEDRKRFAEIYGPLFFKFAAPLPPINAERILALMDAGILDVRMCGMIGKDCTITHDDSSGFTLAFAGDTVRHPHLVETSGLAEDVRRDPSSLAQSLVRIGKLYERRSSAGHYAPGSLEVDNDYNLVRNDGRPSSVAVLGYSIRAQAIDVNSAGPLARKAQTMVGAIASPLVPTTALASVPSSVVPFPAVGAVTSEGPVQTLHPPMRVKL